MPLIANAARSCGGSIERLQDPPPRSGARCVLRVNGAAGSSASCPYDPRNAEPRRSRHMQGYHGRQSCDDRADRRARETEHGRSAESPASETPASNHPNAERDGHAGRRRPTAGIEERLTSGYVRSHRQMRRWAEGHRRERRTGNEVFAGDAGRRNTNRPHSPPDPLAFG